ncbi:hypothetical protein ACFXHD_11470 [Streptomyces hydrogenans]|uniref:hypothetical protein n=1 Tax=Streptomyces hydrogenans TaxID=1873719 RepID=UPI00367A254D
MFVGRPEELRRREQQAAALAAEIARLMTRVEALGVGPVMPAGGRLSGPAFVIVRTDRDRWSVRA